MQCVDKYERTWTDKDEYNIDGVQIGFEPVCFVNTDVDVTLRQLLVVGRTFRQRHLHT